MTSRARQLWVTLSSGQDGKIDFAGDPNLGREPDAFKTTPAQDRVHVVEKIRMDAIRNSMQYGGSWDAILSGGTRAVVNGKHITVAWFKGSLAELDPVNQQ